MPDSNPCLPRSSKNFKPVMKPKNLLSSSLKPDLLKSLSSQNYSIDDMKKHLEIAECSWFCKACTEVPWVLLQTPKGDFWVFKGKGHHTNWASWFPHQVALHCFWWFCILAKRDLMVPMTESNSHAEIHVEPKRRVGMPEPVVKCWEIMCCPIVVCDTLVNNCG